MKKKLFDIVVKLFENLYGQAMNYSFVKPYQFTITDKNRAQIEWFVDWWVRQYKTPNLDLLVHYFEFQFAHYSGVQTPKGKNAIMLHWIIGKVAIDRWFKRDLERSWYIKYKVKKDIQLHLKRVFADELNKKRISNLKRLATKVCITEERFKLQTENSLENRLSNCIVSTTLYNPKSKICAGCHEQQNCKFILKKKNPQIFKLRINERPV